MSNIFDAWQKAEGRGGDSDYSSTGAGIEPGSTKSPAVVNLLTKIQRPSPSAMQSTRPSSISVPKISTNPFAPVPQVIFRIYYVKCSSFSTQHSRLCTMIIWSNVFVSYICWQASAVSPTVAEGISISSFAPFSPTSQFAQANPVPQVVDGLLSLLFLF